MNESDARRLAGLVGLGMRARSVVVGVESVRAAAFRDKLALVMVAPDASHNSLNKVVPLLRARGVRMCDGLNAAALGAAVGRQAVAVVGVVDAQLAQGMCRIVDRGGDAP